MKKSIKSVLAKSLAVAMAFSLAGIAPNTSSDAAAKKPTVTKKVTVKVGKTATVKVTSKKKVKKTTWSLTKKGKKVVSLSKKKAKSVTVKGKKVGSATLTAKIKVGKKTYKKTCKITVKKATVVTTKAPTKAPTNNPNAGGTNGGTNATPAPGTSNTTPAPGTSTTPTPTPAPVGKFTVDGTELTVDEDATYNIPLTSLNETTFTCVDKRPIDADEVAGGTSYNRDGSVSFTSLKEYNSGVSYYINPCTSEDDIEDISETRGEGFLGYQNGTKDMSAYDYIRLEVTSDNEMNLRTYNGNGQLNTAGFPGSSTTETYEGGWIETAGSSIWGDSAHSAGQTVKPEYVKRTVFISIADLISKGCDPSTLTAIAFCPQSDGVEVTIHRIDFVKVNYDTKVTGITVTSNKDEVEPGKTAKVTAAITPANATRKTVKWTSSDEDIATVTFQGNITAKAEGEVTITAAATDGSGVTGSTTITVRALSDDEKPTVIETHKVDLTKVDAKTNTGSDSAAATQTAAGIEFAPKGNMTYVNFAKYLDDNNLDLADYDELRVTWEVRNADGEKVTDYEEGTEDAPSYGKIAYAPEANLNGYGDGIDVNYEGEGDDTKNTGWLTSPYAGETCVLTIAKTNPAELATVAGFNLQVSALPEGMYIVITDITLYKDNNVYVDLTKVDAKTNTGSSSTAATQTAAEIEFAAKGSMVYVSFAKYLDDNKLDLSDFTALQVVWEVRNADGEKVTDYGDAADAPSYGKIAYVPEASLDGFSNGIDTNWEGEDDDTPNTAWLSSPYAGATCTLTIANTNPAELATVAGFNLQLEKLPDDMYIVITGITLVK